MIALAWVAEHFGNGRIRFTNRQNVLVLDMPDEHVDEAKAEMAAAGALVDATSFRRQTISCTGIEFCRLAVSETKEIAAGIIAHLEERMGDLEPPVRINVNGCPNACAQYQIADIGLQGALARRGDEKVLGFQLHLGGRLGEERTFGKRTAKPVPAEDVRFVLERVLIAYRDERETDESFGRWVDRQPEGRMQELVGTQLDEGGIPGSTAYSDPQSLPQVLVTPAWLETHIDDPALAVVEVSEDPTLYPSAHIVGARSIDPADLHGDDGRAPVLERLAELLGERGISPDHTIVLYGDRDNWFASYAFWLLRRLGHRDLRLLDGGRRRWIGEDRPVNADERAHGVVDYPVPPLALPGIRAQRGEVEAVLAEPGTAAARRAHDRGVRGLDDARPGVPARGGRARGAHPRRGAHPVGGRRARGRHRAAARRAARRLRAGGRQARAGHHRVLPHRRAGEPHLARAAGAARVPARSRVRRLLDRVGQAPRSPDRRCGGWARRGGLDAAKAVNAVRSLATVRIERGGGNWPCEASATTSLQRHGAPTVPSPAGSMRLSSPADVDVSESR